MPYNHLISQFLAEDLKDAGDITSKALFSEQDFLKANLNCREDMVIAGLEIAKEVFLFIDPNITFKAYVKDGDNVKKGTTIALVEGPATPLLSAERTALNLLQHLCGIATYTRTYVEKIAHTSAKLLDTRKTTPGLRDLEKMATKLGGATNHRMGLYDAIMIKDNHLATLKEAFPNQEIEKAIEKCRDAGHHFIEIECDTLEQFQQALQAGANRILLDNMPTETLAKAVKINQGQCELEASGNVSLETIKSIAETGVDYISVGRITHSAEAVDIGLDFY